MSAKLCMTQKSAHAAVHELRSYLMGDGNPYFYLEFDTRDMQLLGGFWLGRRILIKAPGILSSQR